MADRSSAIPRLQVLVDGSALEGDEADAVQEIIVEAALGLPSMAEIYLLDHELRFTDGHRPDVGSAIEVQGPGDGGPVTLFTGEVVEIEALFTTGAPVMLVRAFDRLHHLGRHRQLRSFIDLTDADIADEIARAAGMTARCDAAGALHPYLLQQNETDLALLQRRAHALGWQLRAWGADLYFGPLDLAASPTPLVLGDDLSELRTRLSSLGPVKTARVRGWDPSGRAEILAEVTDPRRTASIGEERSGAALVNDAFQIEPEAQAIHHPVRSQKEADDMARTLADASAERAVEAEGQTLGTPALQPGGTVQIKNLGERFSGTYLLSTVRHHQGASGYRTRFTATGARPRLLLDQLVPKSTPGLTVLCAIVTDNQDPDGLGRVQVRYPQLTPDHASPWARLVAPGAGPERGLALIPEVGDEVLVALEMGDISQPYVLGGLWNGQDAPPASDLVSGGKVVRRMLRTRAGHQISLSDATGGGEVIIEDSNGNRVALDASNNGITLSAKGDIVIEAGGNLKLTASMGLSAEANSTLSLNSKTTVGVKATGALTLGGAQISLG